MILVPPISGVGCNRGPLQVISPGVPHPALLLLSGVCGDRDEEGMGVGTEGGAFATVGKETRGANIGTGVEETGVARGNAGCGVHSAGVATGTMGVDTGGIGVDNRGAEAGS
jgi:hypothetical protein